MTLTQLLDLLHYFSIRDWYLRRAGIIIPSAGEGRILLFLPLPRHHRTAINLIPRRHPSYIAGRRRLYGVRTRTTIAYYNAARNAPCARNAVHGAARVSVRNAKHYRRARCVPPHPARKHWKGRAHRIHLPAPLRRTWHASLEQHSRAVFIRICSDVAGVASLRLTATPPRVRRASSSGLHRRHPRTRLSQLSHP